MADIAEDGHVSGAPGVISNIVVYACPLVVYLCLVVRFCPII